MKKVCNDLIMIGIILLIALSFYIPYFFKDTGKGIVSIYQNEELYNQFSLSENRTIILTSEEHGHNLILINEGTVKMSDAECPDQLCVKQGSISRSGESIICLPHKVVIQITSKEESDLDAVTH